MSDGNREVTVIEEESLFARDIDGQLVRLDQVVADDLQKSITIVIDSREVTVPKAVPATDAQGNIRRDAQGRPIPRATTIYDATSKLYVQKLGDKNPIPILCHQDHLDPVAVCRLCSVEIWKVKRGKVQRERKLLPACQHRVEETMEVHTLNSPNEEARERIRSSVATLTELLVADHLTKPQIESVQRKALATSGDSTLDHGNELMSLARKLGIGEPRFPSRVLERKQDDSSAFIAVDHAACILCDRCVRACTEVKHNDIIGRAGKGYSTHIGFDLNDPMGSSNCVSCGECMVSCPTDALTFKQRPAPSADEEEPADGDTACEILQAEEIKKYELFSSVPFKFLQWNTGAVQRRRVRPGEVLCRQGNPGNTAFIIINGEFEIRVRPSSRLEKQPTSGLGRFFGKLTTRAKRESEDEDKVVAIATSDDLIVGEMTCMSHYPRSATVQAKTVGEVLEINRNILFYLQRDRTARNLLDRAYRRNALADQLRRVPMFKQFDDVTRNRCIELLRKNVELVHVDPGQEIFHQGEPADHFYLVRLGFVKVTQTVRGQTRVVDYLGPGKSFGEIGLLSSVKAIASEHFPAGFTSGVRTATCSALDDVELVRIRGEHFRQLIQTSPQAAELLVESAVRMLAQDEAARTKIEQPLDQFLSQGLFNANKLLVLDLESCTRCDECTRACSDTHEGVTRLIREGLRFDKFLVASSCRSCLDPYCLVGCPVDAIHRRPRDNSDLSLEIVIEDHCIGCGLCASNCPYGNINMHPLENGSSIKAQKATTCDLCRDVVPASQATSCVYACPHNAAFRMSGQELLQLVSPTAVSRG
ncbi:MAG: cyclic nucleotide-binding domain-containing protein [Planctomycetia bacterium]|nr:cyclic nucleotide-binding domain-containing protein [Planctomycetia bacterium]